MIICKSCNADIPPQWVAAINSGICPGCGSDIFSLSEKELLCDLREAMEKMETADAASVTSWLVSNYNLHKIGTAEPTEFYRKKQVQPEQFGALKIADNPKSVFLQRAGMARELSRRQNLANIAQQINEVGDDAVSVDLDIVDDSEGEGLDKYEALALAQSRSSQAPAKSALHNNSLLVRGDGDSSSVVEAAMIAQAFGGNKTDGASQNDLPPALQADRYKRLITQQEVASGGMVGKIRRQ